ncbi:hypothetical protein GCM10022295_48640 [Streptomyces osmaniensis]|uniref:Transposase n=1 Tax=Streptomyces osmaniensis TaxID=593134 RepID=A0ABP6X594_9ACTN
MQMYALSVSAYITLLQRFGAWQGASWSHSGNERDTRRTARVAPSGRARALPTDATAT